MSVPSINHPTDRPNFTIVEVNGNQYAFSYRTCVGFCTGFGRWTVRQNVWGPTTGKHLNWLDDGCKSLRLDADSFQIALEGIGDPVVESLTR